MNVSNAAYHKPLTCYKPGLQKEGIDYDTTPAEENGGKEPWYPATEKVMPRVYHKYLKATDLEYIYGPAEEEENPDEPVDPQNPENPDQPSEPENPDQPVEPENPDTPVEPENPDTPVEPENP
jgi:hypothetical protein